MILGAEVDNRVSNDNAGKDFKMKKNEDWEKVFCRTNVIHRIQWNNDECLMCPRWFSDIYCFGTCNYKANHVPNNEVPEDKRKVYKTYLNKIHS